VSVKLISEEGNSWKFMLYNDYFSGGVGPGIALFNLTPFANPLCLRHFRVVLQLRISKDTVLPRLGDWENNVQRNRLGD
jgi:hypothetical protein